MDYMSIPFKEIHFTETTSCVYVCVLQEKSSFSNKNFV